MRLGFTGTRKGISVAQRKALSSWLRSNPASEFHHGCAIGADEQAHQIVAGIEKETRVHVTIVGHPSNLKNLTATSVLRWCDEAREPKPPLERNADIVAACEKLVACPDGPEKTRSGTWATVREARRRGKPVVIVWPNGEVTEE